MLTAALISDLKLLAVLPLSKPGQGCSLYEIDTIMGKLADTCDLLREICRAWVSLHYARARLSVAVGLATQPQSACPMPAPPRAWCVLPML
jgi:hypothetical protein